MLKSHRHLLEPRPSDRLRIGDCIVDLSLREIAPADGSAEPMRVTLKTIGVLLVLIAHAGKVVSREALLEWVWPDTMPTDDVVTQAIAQLRKALREDRERPRYLDTVAKHGYRLIAPVQWLETEPAQAAAPDIQPSDAASADVLHKDAPASDAPAREVDRTGIRQTDAQHAEAKRTPPQPTDALTAEHRTLDTAQASPEPAPSAESPSAAAHVHDASRGMRAHKRALAALAVCAVAIIAFIAWRGFAPRATAPESAAGAETTKRADGPLLSKASLPAYRNLTSRLADEYRPTLSPDGALVAYVEEGEGSGTSSLWVQTTAPVPPRRLTAAVDQQWDVMPSWSPDGREIAFIRENRQGCAVMAMPASGGSPRELGECIAGTRHMIGWYPDGSALIGAQFVTGFSNLAEPRKAEKALYRMPLASGRWQRIAYERAPSDEDLWPVVSPDGRWIVFQRNLSLGDLWRMPAAGGRPERLTHLRGNFYGVDWTPDGRHLLFGRYRDGKVMLAAVEIATGRVREFEHNGRESQMYPDVAHRAGALAFEIETSRNAMRRVDLAEADERTPADSEYSPLMRGERLFETTGSNLVPSIAPDGRQLVFYSDRSGDMRLWWVNQDEPDSLRMLDDFVPVARYPVFWDAQSRLALAIGTGRDGMGAYEIDPQRGRATKLPLPDADPVHIAYHTDPQHLLVVADRGQGRLGVRLYDRRSQPWRVIAQMDDAVAAVVDAPNRRIVLARMSNAELWQTDLNLQNPKKIDEANIQRRNRTITPTPDGIWFMDSRDDCYWLWRQAATSTAASAKPRALCLGHTDWGLVGVSYDPQRRSLYLAMIEEIGSDIGLLPLSALELD